VTIEPQRWQSEPTNEIDFGVFDTEDKSQYIALQLDEEQAETAVMLLNHEGLGDHSKIPFMELQEELYYQLERIPCASCAAWNIRASMLALDDLLICRECQT